MRMQILELATKLQAVGLTDKQAKVYVAALFLGPSPVQKIAQQADVKRATTYVILDELEKMGLVSESTQGNKTVFVAEKPEAIDRFLDNMEKGIAARKKELQNLMPDLQKTSRKEGNATPVVRFYKGTEGSHELSKYLLRKAKKGSSLYAVVNLDKAQVADPKFRAGQLRVKKGISAKVIYYSTGENEELVKSSPERLRVSKPSSKEFTAEFNIYPDSMSMITYSGKDTVGVLIESADIVETMRQIFELAFDNNK